MDSRNITRERLTDCISILLDVDDATHREYGDLITRMITLLQDMRNSMPTEAERIKAKFAELSAKMADEVYGKRANTAISTPDTPPAGVTGSGARYVPIACPTCRGAGIRLVFGNEHADCVDCNGSGECGEIQIFDTPAGKAYMEHLDTVEKRALEAATNRTLNAAHPASGTSDTVAGSGNGGE